MGMTNNDGCWMRDRCNKRFCSGFCPRHYKLSYLCDEALLTPTQRRDVILVPGTGAASDMDAFMELNGIKEDAEGFVSRGESLYLHSGRCGNGKTSWALKIMMGYLNSIWPSSPLGCRALFVSVPKLLLALKDNISERSDYASHVKANVLRADVVIWDDIATKQSTVFEAENLFSMIDSRISAGKSNIFTSNLSDSELHEALGDRLASRISNSTHNIELRGLDKRRLRQEDLR